jgi:hypothetical protein
VIEHVQRDCRACGVRGKKRRKAQSAPDRIEFVGVLIGQVLANCYRADLECAGLGSGRHAFEFIAPAGLAFAPDAVEVRRSLDGVRLEPSTNLRNSSGELRKRA